MKQMKQNLAIKSDFCDKKNKKKYNCNFCDYNTSNKYDYKKHISTRKHKMKQLKWDAEHKAINRKKKTIPVFVCDYCNKQLKSRTTLWRHKKNCIKIINEEKEEKEEIVQNIETKKRTEMDFLKLKLLDLENKLKEKESINQSSDKMLEVLHESQNLLKKAMEQNSNLIPKVGNNNNNKISINVILNEQCKNAPNLEDFVKKLKVSIEDLQYTKNHGYVKGLSNIMVKHLKNLPPNDRPIHCNQNNLQFYVKDSNTWEKDEENTKVTKSINKIQKKQVLKIKDWTDKHPNYCEDDDLYTEYQQMVRATMCLNPIENEDIERNISNIVNINDVVNK